MAITRLSPTEHSEDVPSAAVLSPTMWDRASGQVPAPPTPGLEQGPAAWVVAAGHWVVVIAPTVMVQPEVTHLPTAAIQEPTVPVLLTAGLPTADLHRRVAPIAAVAAVAQVAVAPSAAEVVAAEVAQVDPSVAADAADNKRVFSISTV